VLQHLYKDYFETEQVSDSEMKQYCFWCGD